MHTSEQPSLRLYHLHWLSVGVRVRSPVCVGVVTQFDTQGVHQPKAQPPAKLLRTKRPQPQAVPDPCPIGRRTAVSSGQPRHIGPYPVGEHSGQVSGRITVRAFT